MIFLDQSEKSRVIRMLVDQCGEGDIVGEVQEKEENVTENEENKVKSIDEGGKKDGKVLEEKLDDKHEDSTKVGQRVEISTAESEPKSIDRGETNSKRKKLTLRLDKIPISIEPYLAKAKCSFSTTIPNEISAFRGMQGI